MHNELDHEGPYSLEAEQAILGGLLSKGELYPDVAEIVKGNDFFLNKHQLIFDAIGGVFDKGLDIDVISAAEELGQSLLDDVDGIEYLTAIYAYSCSVANILPYSRVVKEHSRVRGVKVALISALAEVRDVKSFEEASTVVSKTLESTEPETSGYISFNDLLRDRVHDLDSRMRSGAIEGVTTGFKNIDDRYMGWRGGDLIILGGRPSMGKTAVALDITFHVASNHGDVLVFSCEMQKESLTDRLISHASKVNGKRIRTAQMTESDWPKLSSGVQKLKDLPIHIIDTPAIDVNHAINIARKFNRKNKLALIAVDYIQLLRFGKLHGYECISEVSRSLKVMAKELDCPVLGLSQLSRKLEDRSDKRPRMSDLRESGQIEQDADGIIFVYRDEYYNPDTTAVGVTEMISGKVRHGETGTDYLQSDLATMSYQSTTFTPTSNITPIKKPDFMK